jgi:peptide/nickel transport system substrate-binding protein
MKSPPRRNPLTLAICLIALGCGPCGFQPNPGLKIVVPALPSTLDWNTSDPTSWVNYPVMLATQKGLTSLAPGTHEVRPGVAERWESQLTPEGHQVYTFHLRRDVTWSDGTPLTARDYVLGWRRSAMGRERAELDEVLGASRVSALLDAGAPAEEVRAAVERLGVRAVDDATFEVTLDRPRSYFLARVANVYIFFPAPSAALAGLPEDEAREFFDRPRDGKPYAVGPFGVDVWDRAGERLRLVRNPRSAFAPAMGEGERAAEVVTLLKSEVGPALYERGRVDFVFVDSAVALRGPPAADLKRQPLLSTYFLAFNTRRPPLDRPEVRRALSMALDRDALLSGLLPAARTTNVLLPPDLPGAATAEEAARLPRYRPDEARALLEKAGGVTRPLRLVYRATESFVPEIAIAERIKAQLERVGVPVDLEPRADFSAEINRVAADGFRSHDLYLKRIGADYAHPKTFFVLFEKGGAHATDWEQADGGRAIERFEALLARADGETDLAAAQRGYAEAQALLLEEQAVIAPLYHPDRYFRSRPWLRGLTVDPFNFLSLAELRLGPGAPERR